MYTSEVKLNDDLLKEQGVGEQARNEIIKLTNELTKIIRHPKQFTDSPLLAVKEVELLEYKLQRLWNFEQNAAFHSYWFLLDGCICPKLDNEDRFGSVERVYNSECKFHGKNPDQEWCDTTTNITFTAEEISWLHNITQNPLYDINPADEEAYDTVIRHSIFNKTHPI